MRKYYKINLFLTFFSVFLACGSHDLSRRKFSPNQSQIDPKYGNKIKFLLQSMDTLKSEILAHVDPEDVMKKSIVDIMFGHRFATQEQMKLFIESEDFDHVMELSLMENSNDQVIDDQEYLLDNEDSIVSSHEKDHQKNYTHGAVSMVIAGFIGTALSTPNFIRLPKGKGKIYVASHLGVNGSLTALSISMFIVGSMLLAQDSPSQELTTLAGALLATNAATLIFKGGIFWEKSIKIYRDLFSQKNKNNNKIVDRFMGLLENIDQKLKKFSAPRISSSKYMVPKKISINQFIKDSKSLVIRNITDVNKYRNTIRYFSKNNRGAKILGVGLGVLGTHMFVSSIIQSFQSHEMLNLYKDGGSANIIDQSRFEVDRLLIEIYRIKKEDM